MAYGLQSVGMRNRMPQRFPAGMSGPPQAPPGWGGQMGGSGMAWGGGPNTGSRLPGQGWGESAPGTPWSWGDLSYVADPQWLGGFLRDYDAQLGYFRDPRQSAAFDFNRQQAAATSRGIQRRAQGAAELSGLPQGQRGYAWLQGLLGGQGAEVGATNAYLGRQFQDQQDWARNLAAQFAGIPDTRVKNPGLGQTLGQIGGAVGGAFLGGPAGAAAGYQLGGQVGGGGRQRGGGGYSYMGQPGWQYPYGGGY